MGGLKWVLVYRPSRFFELERVWFIKVEVLSAIFALKILWILNRGKSNVYEPKWVGAKKWNPLINKQAFLWKVISLILIPHPVHQLQSSKFPTESPSSIQKQPRTWFSRRWSGWCLRAQNTGNYAIVPITVHSGTPFHLWKRDTCNGANLVKIRKWNRKEKVYLYMLKPLYCLQGCKYLSLQFTYQ